MANERERTNLESQQNQQERSNGDCCDIIGVALNAVLGQERCKLAGHLTAFSSLIAGPDRADRLQAEKIPK